MMQYFQETDSKIVFPLVASDVSYSHPIHIQSANETVGGELNVHYTPLNGKYSFVKQAWETVKRTENKEVAEEAKKLLLLIQGVLQNLQIFELDYPLELSAFNVDDGSVLIEWKSSDFRLGFSLEPNHQESGWYLVTNRKLGEISASGFLSHNNIHSLVLWLINFVFAHS